MTDNLPATQEDTTKPNPTGSTGPKNIPLATIIKYRKQGLKYDEIGQLVGCSKSNISERLSPLMDNIDALPAYKEHRADIIDIVQQQILNNMTESKLEKMSAYQLSGMYGLFYDKGRLESDKSTQNIATTMQLVRDLRGDD